MFLIKIFIQLSLYSILLSIFWARPLNIVKEKRNNFQSTTYKQNNKEVKQNNKEENIFFETFDNSDHDWLNDSGWQITTSNSYTEPNSFNSPNDESTENGVWDLITPVIDLPLIPSGEIINYSFNTRCDMPDYQGEYEDINGNGEPDCGTTPEDDCYLGDYYIVSIQDMSDEAWHTSNFNSYQGNSWWCGSENIGGYQNGWAQYLDTPEISIGNDFNLSAYMQWAIEDATDVDVSGTCADGWDQANVQISLDGGSTFSVIEGDDPYDFECGYGSIWNGFEGMPGWAGISEWHQVNFDLSDYAGQTAIIRFAFYSDPAWSTIDNSSYTGFQVDNISIGTFNDDADGSTQMSPAGAVWSDQFYDYCSPLSPGYLDWENYEPGRVSFPYESDNISMFLMDISEYQNKKIRFRIKSIYDDNNLQYDETEINNGTGLFIDNFRIYSRPNTYYPPPIMGSANPNDNNINIIWQDMNHSGSNEEYSYSNNVFNADQETHLSLDEAGTAKVGTLFPNPGKSIVNSISIYNVNDIDTEVTITGHNKIVNYYNPTYSYISSNGDTIILKETFELNSAGWNTLILDEPWEFDSYFLLAQEFNNEIFAPIDITAIPSKNSWINLGGNWQEWNQVYSGYNQYDGEWGIKANLDTEPANVDYKVWKKDGPTTYNLLTEINDESNQYIDTEVEDYIIYTYAVSAIYPNGIESALSDSIETSISPTDVKEWKWDDNEPDITESSENNKYLATQFYSNNSYEEDLVAIKWYQSATGGIFWLTIWDDNENQPNNELFTKLITATNTQLKEGWNSYTLSEDDIISLSVGEKFWVGMRQYSSTSPIAIDKDCNTEHSMRKTENTWELIDGNILFRVFLKCNDDCESCSNGESLGCDNQCSANPVTETECCFCGGEPLENVCDSCYGCMDETACNYSPTAQINSGICYEEGDPECIFIDDCGIEDGCNTSCTGCNDVSATNYGETETGEICTWLDNNEENQECLFDCINCCNYQDNFNDNEANIDNNLLPNKTELLLGYPNPFNPTLTIPYTISNYGNVKISLYNIKGQLITNLVNKDQEPGYYNIIWDGTNFASGIYFIIMTFDQQSFSHKFTLIK